MNTFCKHQSNSSRIFIRGDKITYLPCCYWQGNEIPFIPNHLQTQRNKIDQNIPWVHPECSKCRKEEEINLKSIRKVGNNTIPNGIPNNKIVWLEFQVDTTCNGGCYICGPWSSSFWQKEMHDAHGTSKLPIQKDFTKQIEHVFNSIDTSELRFIQFLGGEPFLSSVDKTAMYYIKNPEICKLKYTTNGSIFPTKDRIDLWDNFKEILINFSIDGIGPHFDYLRYPLKWDIVKENIQKFIDLDMPNMSFHINHSLTPLNLWHYAEFEDWAYNTFNDTEFRGIHAHPAYGIMSPEYHTEKLKSLLLEKYDSEHMIIKMLEKSANPEEFLEYIEFWDNHRNLNWKETFSEIVDCYN